METFSWLPSMVLMFLMAGFMMCRADECAQGGANGCDFHSDTPFLYKERFKPACNRHDVCYDCGVSYSIDREACDLALRDDMIEMCRQDYMDSPPAENGTDQNLVQKHKEEFDNVWHDEYLYLKQAMEAEFAVYGVMNPIPGGITHGAMRDVVRPVVNLVYDRMDEQNENNEVVGMVNDETNENFNNDLDLLVCYAFAENFYTYVNTAGGPRYRTSPASYCQDSFVPGCLPSEQ